MIKSTYGTSCFALLNTGPTAVRSRNNMLTTLAYRLDGTPTYALEGAIFSVGSALQWLRDDVGIINDWAEANAMAKTADPDQAVYLVPAFSGLGAPWWDNGARGAYFGLTRNTRRPELVKAALEAVGYQSLDMIEAMRRDLGRRHDIVLRVDGGMVASDWTMQFLADILQTPVDCSRAEEVTALGAAWLAGWKSGVWPDADGFAARRNQQRAFQPRMDGSMRKRKLKGWREAIARTLTGIQR